MEREYQGLGNTAQRYNWHVYDYLRGASLPTCSNYVLIVAMSRIEPQAIAQSILTAPDWARASITAPSDIPSRGPALALPQSILAEVEDEMVKEVADQNR